jgi:hypothetical protein
LLAGNEIVLPRLGETWLAMAYMVVIGSGIVFILWVFVLKRWDASRAAYNFVLLPPITLVFSNLITGEEVGVELILRGGHPGRCVHRSAPSRPSRGRSPDLRPVETMSLRAAPT